MKPTAEIKTLALRLPVRSDLHLLRKIWHMGMGLSMALIYLGGMPVITALSILGAALAIAWTNEVTRLRNPQWNMKMVRFWGPIMRSSEVNRMSGVPSYLASALVAVAIFPKPVAVVSILYLACGDPIASLFGILYGDRGLRYANGKSLIGTLAGVLACVLVGLVFFSGMGLSLDTLVALSVIGGIAGGTAELLPFEVDDNFTIPVISGFVLWFAFIFLGV